MGSADRHTLIIGSSDGVGLATARLLLDEGWTVTGISRSRGPIVHEGYRHWVCDVCAAEYEDTLRDVLESAGTPSRVIFCVGVGNDEPPERGIGEARTVETNLVSAVRTLEVLLPCWHDLGSGHFVGLTSLADAFHLPDGASYCASKIGLGRYLECVGLRVRSFGIAVTHLRFGFVDTKMARSDHKPFCIPVREAAEVVRSALDERPLRRSYPRRAAVAAACLGAWTRLRVATHRPGAP